MEKRQANDKPKMYPIPKLNSVEKCRTIEGAPSVNVYEMREQNRRRPISTDGGKISINFSRRFICLTVMEREIRPCRNQILQIKSSVRKCERGQRIDIER